MSSVIKRTRVQRLSCEEASDFLEWPVRLRKGQVHLRATASDAEASGTSLGQRVLRGEEIQAAAQPFEVDLPELKRPSRPPSEATAPAGAGEDERTGSQDLEALRAAWEAAWQTRLETAVAEARQESYEQGYIQAQEDLQADFDERLQACTQAVTQLQDKWQEYLEATEPLLTELALQIAESLLDTPLPQAVKGASARAIAEAVERLGGEAPLVVALHPVDYQRLQETDLPNQLESVHEGLRWDVNPDVSEGDWIVQSPEAVIRHVKDELVQTLKRRLGLLSIVQKYHK